MIGSTVIIGEQPVAYFKRSSGLCTDVSSESLIGTKEDCEEGARHLEMKDTGATVESKTNCPRGCYDYYGRWLKSYG